jgi:hypothetical protein
MVRIIQPCIGDVWEFHEGGLYTVVNFVRHFGTGREFVVCEGERSGDRRIWPKDAWMYLVPYGGGDARPGAMVRPFTLVRQGLRPRTDSLFGRPTTAGTP